jgi:hypothetical protein
VIRMPTCSISPAKNCTTSGCWVRDCHFAMHGPMGHLRRKGSTKLAVL